MTTPEKAVEELLLHLLPHTRFAHHAYAVGGYVRDEVLGRPSKDLDIVVDLEGGAEALAVRLRNLFPHEVSMPHQIGAGYPIWHVAFRHDVTYEGRLFATAGAELDLADTQTETFPDAESRQRVTQFASLEDDVRRRDFTVNMLMKDLTVGALVDMTGCGLKDISDGLLRVHPDVPAEQPFREDPLRMLRAIRFALKYQWNIVPETMDAIRANAARIQIVSGERVRDELVKCALIGKLGPAVHWMDVLDLLQYVLPEIKALDGVTQPRAFHAEGDVLRHTYLVLAHAPATVEGQFAALLHDVGKPDTRSVTDTGIHFYGHEVRSAEIAEVIMRRLRFDGDMIRLVCALVGDHMRVNTLAVSPMTDKSVRKFLRETEGYTDALLDLSTADEKGGWAPNGQPRCKDVERLRVRVEDVRNAPVQMNAKPVLTGHEVMACLGLVPGAAVGAAIAWLQDRVDEYAADGNVLTPDEAVRILRDDYKEAP